MDFTEKLFQIVLFMPGFLFSLAWHESAHGYVANLLGDPTAKNLGRVTLNPLPHMDPIGTFLLPILGIFTGFFFGWGIPVPVDYRNLKNVRRDGMLIALAGPASNLVLAVVISLIIRFVVANQMSLVGSTFAPHHLEIVVTTLVNYLYLNLGLCFFNLIPIQPLDGGKIAYGVLPIKTANKLDGFTSRYGPFILLFLFLVQIGGHSLLSLILLPPILFVGQLLL